MIGGTHNRFSFAPVSSTYTERSRSGVDLTVSYILMVCTAVLLSMPTFAQDDPGPCDMPTDKKVVKLLDDAAKAKDNKTRQQKLRAAIDLDATCAPCLLQLGQVEYRIARDAGRSTDAAIRFLEQLDAQCPDYHSDVPYFLGMMYFARNEFAPAGRYLERFRRFPQDDPKRLNKNYDKQYQEVEALMPELQFFIDFYGNKTPFNPSPLPNLSTPADEYLPMLSPDNEIIFYTRLSKVRDKGDIVARDVEELMEARRSSVKTDFQAGKALPEPFNQGDSYGGVTISVNNKEMFVTICEPADANGYRNCDIFRTHYDSKFNMDVGGQVFEWTEPRRLGSEVNTRTTWESQPTLTADGRTMYFATNRPGSKGNDIYQSTRDEAGNWSEAVPVPGINTAGDEKAPFLHSDSRTLYFAARPPVDERGQVDVKRGHRGAGGYDIFYSRMGDDGVWSKPRNLGHPINTEQDEHGLIVSADGRTAYFASNRFKGAGGLDIFSFELPREARPDDILVLKGEVRDEKGEVVRDARVEVKYMDTRQTEVMQVDNADGRYATVLRLKAGDNVTVTVKKDGHVFDARTFSVEDTLRGGTAEVDMTVQKIQVGRSYQINDIRYATNSAAITKGSEFILDELVVFLTENPTVKIRIEGHTDNVGRLEDNMALSNDRAFTVMQYLQDKGIKGARLSFKGLGPTKPKASNDTAEGRAENRRTEFVIVGR